MKLYMLRHGQTMANISYQYCGVTDSPLSPEGKQLLAEKRESCAYPSVEGLDVYTSGLTRTEQTLEILYGDVPHSVDRGFAEMNFGIFEGRSYDELKDTEEYQAWLAGDHIKNRCPGGESGADVLARVLKSVDGLLEKDRDAMVVCHGGVIALLFYHYFPDTEMNWYEVQPKNGEGYVFEYENGQISGYTRIPAVKQ